MRVTCTECEAEMVDSVLRHKDDCSAHNFMPRVMEYQRPPSQTITFDSPEEQEKFMKGLSGGSGDAGAPPTPEGSNKLGEDKVDFTPHQDKP